MGGLLFERITSGGGRENYEMRERQRVEIFFFPLQGSYECLGTVETIVSRFEILVPVYTSSSKCSMWMFLKTIKTPPYPNAFYC